MRVGPNSILDTNTYNAVISWGLALSSEDIIFYVDSIAELRSIAIQQVGTFAFATGYYAQNDGGGGLFYLVNDETYIDNNGTTISSILTGYCWKRLFSGVVDIRWFGAKGDGVTDDTASIQNALDVASDQQLEVNDRVYSGLSAMSVYSVSTITVKNGLKKLDITRGCIKGQGVAPKSVVQLVDDAVVGTVNNAVISVTIDMSGGDRIAISGDCTQNCIFENNYIYGFTDHPTLNHYGILLENGSSYNVIQYNQMIGYTEPTQRGLLIDITAVTEDYSNYFDNGNIVNTENPSVHNTITYNQLIRGSYGVNLLGAEYTMVAHNQCVAQNHRAVYLANASNHNIISNNNMLNYTSSAVVLGYGSSFNLISDNKCERETLSGESAININTGASHNMIVNNLINSANNFGIYIGPDSVRNSIIENDIRNYYIAGIAIENDWVSPLPSYAYYSRSNYAPPPIGSKWSFNNSVGNSIDGNIIREAYTGRNVTGIYLAQIDANGSTSFDGAVIQNNKVITGDNLAYNIYIYANTDNKMSGLKLSGNIFHNSNTCAIYNPNGSTTWNDKVEYFNNNEQLDTFIANEPIELANGDGTPSVLSNCGLYKHRYYYCNHTSPTTITNFDDGFDSMEIMIRLNTNTTIQYNSSLIRPKGLIDVTGASSNTFISFKRVNGIWMEIFRSF